MCSLNVVRRFFSSKFLLRCSEVKTTHREISLKWCYSSQMSDCVQFIQEKKTHAIARSVDLNVNEQYVTHLT